MAPTATMRTFQEIYSKGAIFVVIAAMLVSIALLIFLLRVYIRTKLLRFFSIDDWLMLVSVLCMIGLLIIFALLVRYGPVNHETEMPLENEIWMSFCLWCFTLMVAIGINFVKLSVAFLLLRIASRTHHRRLLYGLIVALIPLTLVWFATVLFQCVPVPAAWNRIIQPQARCMSHLTYRTLALFNNSVNITTNVIFAMLPLSIIPSIRLDSIAKMYLAVALGFGFMSCAAAIIRIPMMYDMWNKDDPLTHSMPLCIWGIIEMTTGVIATCLPTLKPLLAPISTLISHIKSLCRPNNSPKLEPSSELPPPPPPPPPPSPYPQSCSTPTFLSLPRPTPTRFHDHTSELDFELFNAPSKWTHRHSRNPSSLTVLSSFTTFMSQVEKDGAEPIARTRTRSKELSELEEDMERFQSGYAVSITSGSEVYEESDDTGTISRAASEDSGVVRSEGSSSVATGGIMKTMEVRIS